MQGLSCSRAHLGHATASLASVSVFLTFKATQGIGEKWINLYFQISYAYILWQIRIAKSQKQSVPVFFLPFVLSPDRLDQCHSLLTQLISYVRFSHAG